MEKVTDIIKKYKLNIVAVIIIFALAIFLRTYKLESIPSGVNVDEAGMAYDAFCIANFRVDRALNKLPVYFVNFGGGQSVLYGYVTSVFIKLFGFNLTSIRVTAVIFNCLAIGACYLMIRKTIGEKSALLLTLLLTINPWNIMSSRWGLDCNLLAPCLIISLCFLLRAKKWYDYVLAGISFGVTLYTYAISYIIVPLFLLLSLIYMLYVKKINFKNIIILGIPIFVFALPLMLMLLVNNGFIDQINWIITIPKLPNYRSAEVSFKNIITNIKSLDKIFVYDDLPFNSLPKFGTLYNFAIILSVCGIGIEIFELIKSIKQKKFKVNSIIFLLFISVAGTMLLIADINISKSNAIYFPLIFFSYSSIHYIYQKQNTNLKKDIENNKKIEIIFSRILLLLITVMYIINFSMFTYYYFTKYAEDYEHQQFFEKDLIEAIRQVNGRMELKDKKVYIFTGAERPHIYALYANPISPYEFNETRDENDNYGRFIVNEKIIDDSYAYIVRADSDFSYRLVQDYGFTSEVIGIYILLYKI